MPSILYLDCFSGASGDMLLGALVDLGVPLDALAAPVRSLGLTGVEIVANRVTRAGVTATRVQVVQPGNAPRAEPRRDHAHEHHHHGHGAHDPRHPHRSPSDILALIAGSALSAGAKARASALVTRLAGVEASIHDMPVEQVHLHEVGAVDSIVDIVGCVVALEWLGVDEVVASPLNTGSGTVRCAHGVLPVPAPATLRLVGSAPIYADGPAVELLTPTGALLVTAYASRFGPWPPMRVSRIGYGAGTRDFPGRPNVLRAVIGETVTDTSSDHERALVLEFEVDDMNPQLFGPLMDRLYADGAREVFFTPVQMKKLRPGVLVTVVASPERRPAITDSVFRETTTIGLRYHEVRRECLERTHVRVETAAGPVRVKVASRDGRVVNAAPEFEDCVRAAGERGLAVKDVQALAVKAYLDGIEPA